MMKYQVNIPDYFTVKHYKEFDRFAHLEERDQMLAMISLLTETSREDLNEWPIQLLVKVYNHLNETLKGIEPEFYPVIEWEGQTYGFQPMHKMTAGEYIDMDNLSKDTKSNLNALLAVLYRPITKNKLDSTKFVTKTVLRAYNGEIENPFDYYELEKYDSSKRKDVESKFDSFPVNVALGAMTFFLDSKAPLLKNTATFFPQWDETQMMMKEEMKSKTKYRLANTMAGYLRCMNLQKPPSYTSQGINQ